MDTFTIVIAAAVVSLVVEGLKRLLGTVTPAASLLALVAVAFFGASLMTVLKSYGLWESFVQLAVSASGIYGLLVQHLPKSEA